MSHKPERSGLHAVTCVFDIRSRATTIIESLAVTMGQWSHRDWWLKNLI